MTPLPVPHPHPNSSPLVYCQKRFSGATVAMTQLQLTATGGSDVSPPEKLLSDGGSLPGRAGRALTLRTAAFVWNLLVQ